MIYQLKITLLHFKPKVWRRVLSTNCSFHDLHKIIQSCFEWKNMHLHEFEVRKSNGVMFPKSDSVLIGEMNDINSELFYNWEDEEDLMLDEETEEIKDWIIKEGDKLLYRYDFGEDWTHEIMLEAILPSNNKEKYPMCVKAVGIAPQDNSRALFHTDSNKSVEKSNDLNLLQTINSKFQTKQHGTPLWSDLLHLAKEFKTLKLWELLDDDQIFAIQMTVDNTYIYCSVLGSASEVFGLAAFVGDEGWQSLQEIISGQQEDSLQQRSLLLSFCNRDELDEEDYQIIKESDFSFRGKHAWPQFRSFIPRYLPWSLDNNEIDVFCTVLEQAILIGKSVINDNLVIPHYPNGLIPARIWQDDEWRQSFISIPSVEDRQTEAPPPVTNELAVYGARKKYKKMTQAVEMALFPFIEPVQDQPDERPYFPMIYVMIEHNSGIVMDTQIMQHENITAFAQESFLGSIDALRSIPSEIWMTETTAHYLQPILKILDIKVVVVQTLPLVEELKQSFLEHSVFRH
ncbi:plasmid pRiA4b ORF-3 family protein [Bacillus salinus]|uniref:plasmid pRiA4b ORF-3 family protein n=1 Tax=Bacillus sp. HMF5848 TaxID=2495421 RepID=UPI00163AF867|nr:plasmid pRiA4b ORF-3 family protein [Bacillus sp. HMF5848]